MRLHDNEPCTFIEKLTDVQKTVQQLMDQLQASEHDKFAAHLYQARREFRHIPNGRAREASRSNAPCSQGIKSRRASDSRATFAPGNTCSGFTSEVKSRLVQPVELRGDLSFKGTIRALAMSPQVSLSRNSLITSGAAVGTRTPNLLIRSFQRRCNGVHRKAA